MEPETATRRRPVSEGSSTSTIRPSTNTTGPPSAEGDDQYIRAPNFSSIVQRLLFNLNQHRSRLSQAKCRKCSSPIFSSFQPTSYVDSWAEEASKRSRFLPATALTAVKCKAVLCNTTTCLGCGKQPDFKETVEVGDLSFKICCSASREVLIWILLCYLDERAFDNEQSVRERLTAAAARPGAFQPGVRVDLFSPNSPYFIPGTNTFNPFADNPFRSPAENRAAHEAQYVPPPFPGILFDEYFHAQERALHDYPRNEDYLQCICQLLPDAISANEANRAPSELLLSMLVLSSFLDLTAEIVANYNANDTSRRVGLYTAARNVAFKLFSHPGLSSLAKDPRLPKRESNGLEGLSGDNGAQLVLGTFKPPSLESILLGRDSAS